MDQRYRIDHLTKDYLDEFNCLLEEMIRGVTQARLSDSISYNFMVQMIPHHRAAVGMSRNLLKYSHFGPLRDIAEKIAAEQAAEIRSMEHILHSCRNTVNCDKAWLTYQSHADRILQTMFCEIKHARTVSDINADFLYEMIPLHKGAVRLSEYALKYNLCHGLPPILRAGIASQKQRVSQMEALLCRLDS